MKTVLVIDKTQDDKIVAEMPLFVWNLAGWLCKYDNAWGLLGGNIHLSYKWDYKTGRSWWATLVDAVKVWWGCRPWKE